MTELLKSVLTEHADSAGTPSPDVAAIIRAGDRQVRRRRLGGTVLGVAAVVAIATVGPSALPGSSDDASDQIADSAGAEFAEPQPSYAAGSSIYYGDRVIDLGPGISVGSYVRTDDGFVFATKSGEVYFNDGERTVPVGRTSPQGLYLKSGHSGSYAAWVEFPAGKAPEFVVYDTSKRREVVRTNEGNAAGMGSFRDTDAAYIYAVDGRHAYWRSGAGAVKYDIAAGEAEILTESASPFALDDVARGVFARAGGDEGQLVISDSFTGDGTRMPTGGNAVLSPDASYVAVEGSDEMAVYDTNSKQPATPRMGDYPFSVVYAWLDDATAVAVGVTNLGGEESQASVDVLTCEVPAGTCNTVFEDIGGFGEFVLPVGERLE